MITYLLSKEKKQRIKSMWCNLSFLEHARFVGGNHVFDVDEGVWAAPFFQYFQSFLDQITNIFMESLMVVNGVTHIHY